MRVVTIGECMVELSPTGGGLLRQGFAGDTFNMAWYLRRLLPAACSVDYLSAVGSDALSDQMLGFMQTAGVGVAHVARVDGRSVGIYLITLQNGERSFSYWRDSSAAKTLADDPAALAQGLAGAGLVVFSGITLAILSQAGRATLLAAIAQARAAGAVVAFDPNMRERLWPDAADLRYWIAAAAAGADVVLPSFDEDARVFGDASPTATIARYRGWGAGCVVVKNGAGIVQAWDGATHQMQPAPSPVVDSTAAGDSFNAGFLAARIQGAAMAACLHGAANLAAQVIAAPGALVAPKA
ncbi:2-dehydro-3-deoxygluconokinase [Cypionkella aquatica]|uniref:2-dehydro-3-deoxygluconokinase n=1 Tax=Cypionkella aquatica TaxID=1756042 RepID=A0AA37TPA3_9RHOB|nr:sugar kinase [Cypionkella aquatica]GLS85379.1 2-dehydro-3-deoxygluconokinase [Cypionkella aquatica]